MATHQQHFESIHFATVPHITEQERATLGRLKQALIQRGFRCIDGFPTDLREHTTAVVVYLNSQAEADAQFMANVKKIDPETVMKISQSTLAQCTADMVQDFLVKCSEHILASVLAATPTRTNQLSDHMNSKVVFFLGITGVGKTTTIEAMKGNISERIVTKVVQVLDANMRTVTINRQSTMLEATNPTPGLHISHGMVSGTTSPQAVRIDEGLIAVDCGGDEDTSGQIQNLVNALGVAAFINSAPQGVVFALVVSYENLTSPTGRGNLFKGPATRLLNLLGNDAANKVRNSVVVVVTRAPADKTLADVQDGVNAIFPGMCRVVLVDPLDRFDNHAIGWETMLGLGEICKTKLVPIPANSLRSPISPKMAAVFHASCSAKIDKVNLADQGSVATLFSQIRWWETSQFPGWDQLREKLASRIRNHLTTQLNNILDQIYSQLNEDHIRRLRQNQGSNNVFELLRGANISDQGASTVYSQLQAYGTSAADQGLSRFLDRINGKVQATESNATTKFTDETRKLVHSVTTIADAVALTQRNCPETGDWQTAMQLVRAVGFNTSSVEGLHSKLLDTQCVAAEAAAIVQAIHHRVKLAIQDEALNKEIEVTLTEGEINSRLFGSSERKLVKVPKGTRRISQHIDARGWSSNAKFTWSQGDETGVLEAYADAYAYVHWDIKACITARDYGNAC